MANFNLKSQKTGCPVYTQKLNFDQCEKNSIVDFLLSNDRIAQYLMINHTKEYNALIENNALRKEIEKIMPKLHELYRQKRLLEWNINAEYRKRGAQSPIKKPWRMSYAGEGGEIPGDGWDWEMSSKGGKMRRHFTRRRIARKTRRIARKTRHIAFKLHRKHL
jgi:hypothetical protein